MRIKKNAFVLAVVVTLGLALPGFVFAQNYPPSVGQLVATTKKQVKTIDMAALKAALDQGEAGIIVDVREPGEYAHGHLSGAINVPRGMVEFNIWTMSATPRRPTWGRSLRSTARRADGARSPRNRCSTSASPT